MMWVRMQLGITQEPPGTKVDSIDDARKLMHYQVDELCDTFIAKALVKKQREDKDKRDRLSRVN